MQGIMTTRELTDLLLEYPPDTPVMIAVVKYPEEFTVRVRDGQATWSDHSDVEVIPMEHGDVTLVNGMTTLCVELMDYDAQRHFAGG